MQTSGSQLANLNRTVQRTLRNAIDCVGMGLCTGSKVSLTIKPGVAGSGIRFLRYDRADRTPVPARFDRVFEAMTYPSLGQSRDTSIAVVEHIMAALAACEIDNALIEVSGPELPIMDGSAKPFMFLIECAGVVSQNQPRRWIKILRPIRVSQCGESAGLEPAAQFEVDYAVCSENPLIDRQALRFYFTPDDFKTEIASARAFTFAEHMEDLWPGFLRRGRVREGGVVVSRKQVLNQEGLRFIDEFVRHQILDTIGDLYTVGAPIIGRFVGRNAGHAIRNELVRLLFADRDAWCYVTAADEAAVHGRSVSQLTDRTSGNGSTSKTWAEHRPYERAGVALQY